MTKTKVNRETTKTVYAGGLPIGGKHPVVLQSMTSRPIDDIEGTLLQIERLEKAGAQMVRLAVRDKEALTHLKAIVDKTKIPLVADIHFDYRLALGAIDLGISKIRINPGNIGDERKVKEVVTAAAQNGIPIRIGVNGGSINRRKYDHPTPTNLVKSALEHIEILEKLNFDNIVISIKSSNIADTIEANRIMARERNYPLHLGLTEAGFGLNSIVQSSIAIGSLLLEGIGSTIRVSMTGDPVEEIIAGRKILESIGLKYNPVRIISCPTCGRTSPAIDILELAMTAEKEVLENFQSRLAKKKKEITIAIMGCEVNGPGEASEADLGLAGCLNGKVMIFTKGKRIETTDYDLAIPKMLDIVEKSLNE